MQCLPKLGLQKQVLRFLFFGFFFLRIFVHCAPTLGLAASHIVSDPLPGHRRGAEERDALAVGQRADDRHAPGLVEQLLSKFFLYLRLGFSFKGIVIVLCFKQLRSEGRGQLQMAKP